MLDFFSSRKRSKEFLTVYQPIGSQWKLPELAIAVQQEERQVIIKDFEKARLAISAKNHSVWRYRSLLKMDESGILDTVKKMSRLGEDQSVGISHSRGK
jgi:hypothetical protein